MFLLFHPYAQFAVDFVGNEGHRLCIGVTARGTVIIVFRHIDLVVETIDCQQVYVFCPIMVSNCYY